MREQAFVLLVLGVIAFGGLTVLVFAHAGPAGIFLTLGAALAVRLAIARAERDGRS